MRKPRHKDLTGQRFGQLVVLERAGADKHKSSLWRCLCDCGASAVKSAHALTSGSARSCGCIYPGRGDLIGMRVGRLRVIAAFEGRSKKGDRLWECLCDCGNKVVKATPFLVREGARSCGCLYRDRGHDLTGRRFGRLLVVSEAGRPVKLGRIWNCQCDCGNRVVRAATMLLREKGAARSCGCISWERRDITGRRFGHLIAVEPVGFDKRGKQLWRCICDCGTETRELTTWLKTGRATSCGCVSKRARRSIVRSSCRRRPQLARLVHNARKTFTPAEWKQVQRIVNERRDFLPDPRVVRMEAVEAVLLDRSVGEMACHGGPLRSL